jgi:hypothetical protein
MSFELMKKGWDLDMSATRKIVYLALADMVRDDGVGMCFPSVPYLSRKCGLSTRAVQKSLAELQSTGLIRKKYREGHSSEYFLNIAEGGKTSKSTGPDLLRGYGVDEELINKFLANRNKYNKSVDKGELEKIEGEARKAGISLACALEFIVQSNWRNFKADWYLKKTTTRDPDPETREYRYIPQDQRNSEFYTEFNGNIIESTGVRL